MYKYNNIEDREFMKRYHRTNDMMNLLLFFPKVSPVIDLTLVTSVEDYDSNKDYLDTLKEERIDNPLKNPTIDVPYNLNYRDLLIEAKKEDLDAALLLFNLNIKGTERYKRTSGISILVDVNNCVIIEAVGKGFDGREVSKGICCHERYNIPCNDLMNLNIDNFKNYRTYLINNSDYKKTREERINYLRCLNNKDFEDKIPIKYEEISNITWKYIILDILKKLDEMSNELISSNLKTFGISGHSEDNIFTPWQMFDQKRY